MAKGKYCDYYWSVKKTAKGWIWEIRSDWKKGAEVLQSSLDNEDEDDKHFKTEGAARCDVYEAIQDYYS